MSLEITPCLWFVEDTSEVAAYYCQLFDNASLIDQSGMVTEIEINRKRFTLLSQAQEKKINEAISFFMYCGSDEYIAKIYSQMMADGGKVLMPLNSYPWSRKYAWVKDIYGVSWQLDVDPINHPQKIVPAIMFVNEQKEKIQEALKFYPQIFENSTIVMSSLFPGSMGLGEDVVQFAQIKLNDNLFNLMSSHEEQTWEITEGISFVIRCKDQGEIDYYSAELTKEGGKFGRCGWLKDQYGISWQVIPENLNQLLRNPENVSKMMKMNKIIIDDFN